MATDLSTWRPTLKILGRLTVSMESLTNLHRDYPSFGGFPGTIDTIYCLICKRIRRIGSNKPQPPLFGPARSRRTGSAYRGSLSIRRLPRMLIHMD